VRTSKAIAPLTAALAVAVAGGGCGGSGSGGKAAAKKTPGGASGRAIVLIQGV